jgi:hypothetical protein
LEIQNPIHSLNQKITLTKNSIISLINDHHVEHHTILVELIDAVKRKNQALRNDHTHNPIKQSQSKQLNHAIHHLEEALLNL